ncbi:S-layer homology domain-containing protein [Paenibacillus sp. GCM10012303]|uniref:S-layer homology domain-containing protein n=1 Tax=Paenibacillus sp. GCM10012303 TaxID=3317340 RepID=UPI0036238DD1
MADWIHRKRAQRLSIVSGLTVFALLWQLFSGALITYAQNDTSERSDAGFSDMQDHWSGTSVAWAVQNGIVSGYPDGTFRPDREMTRAEFVTAVNKTLGYATEGTARFTDVGAAEWFAPAFRVAAGEGYLTGYEDGTVRPHQPVTRQEAAVILARTFKLTIGAAGEAGAAGDTGEPGEAKAALDAYADSREVQDWAKAAVGRLIGRAYLNGYPDRTLRPQGGVSRGEIVALLGRIAGDVYGKPGQAGPDSGSAHHAGNVTVTADGVTLRNQTIDGDLYITSGVGSGSVELVNVTVKGTTIVAGGGPNSIVVRDSELANMRVDKKDGNVRILAAGTTSIRSVQLVSGAVLEEQMSGNHPGFGQVTAGGTMPEGSRIVLDGDFESVTVQASGIAVELRDGTIHTFETGAGAGKLKLTVNGHIETLTVRSAAEVTGTGTIRQASVLAGGVAIAQTPVELKLGEGVTAQVGGKPVSGPVPGAGGTGGIGSGSSGESPDTDPPGEEPPAKAAIEAVWPEPLGAGPYLTVPVTATGSDATAAGPVRIAVEKRSGEGDVYWSATDRSGRVVNIANTGVFMEQGFALPARSSERIDWTVKFTKVGDYSLSFRIETMQGEVLAASEKTVNVTPSIMNLGPQVLQDGINRGAFGTENGKAVGYAVITGKPDSRFVVVDIETEKVVKQFDLPGAEGAWGVYAASNGDVYLGTYTSAKLFRYDPSAGVVEDVGSPLSSVGGSLLYEMTEDRDGNIYYGSYPDSKVFKFDPVTRQTTDLGTMVEGQPYSRSIAYDPNEHALYVGVGGNKASLIKYDLATGAKTELLPEPIRSRYKHTYDMNLIGNKLFLKMDSNFGLIVMDITDGSVVKDFGDLAIHSRGTSSLSPDGKTVYLTFGGILKAYDLTTDTITDVTTAAGKIDFKANAIGWGMAELNDPDYPGHTLVGFVGNTGGGFFKYNLQQKTLRQTNLELPKIPLKLHALGKSTDGNIYTAGFLPGGMGIYNPSTGISSSNSISQVEGMTALGQYMYFGVYPGAKIFQYDTTKPWKSSGSGLTVVNKFELKTAHQQDRPYAMLGVPELNKVFIGTVPDYAVSGGALTVYDPAAAPGPSYQVYEHEQSVVALAYLNGKIYGGTSYRGGLGTEWPYADGKLFVFDPATGAMEREIVPVPGKGAVNELIAGPDGNLWGFAQGTFFVYDPVLGQVVYTDEAFPESTGAWLDPQMEISVKDGHVYGTIAGDNFFRIDKDTKQMTVLHKGASLLAQDNDGNFYFKLKQDESVLWRYTIEDRTVAANDVSIPVREADVYLNDTLTVTADVYPVYATLKNVVWSTSNASVATVSASGVITPVAEGTAVITAKIADGSRSASITVHVKERIRSEYELSTGTVPAVIEAIPVTVPVQVKTTKLGAGPLENAYYTLEKTAGPGSIAFEFEDAGGVVHSFTDRGEYGRPGLTVPAQVNAAMNWKMTFSSPGDYSVTIRLVDAAGATVAETIRTIAVQPKPVLSTYTFASAVTNVTYGVYGTVPVTLRTDVAGLNGYSGAKLKIETVSAPGSLSFELVDGGRTYSFAGSGEIRPDGFDVAALYNETMLWTIKADQPGAYRTRWTLIGADGRTIVQNDLYLVAAMPYAVTLANGDFEQPQLPDGTIPGWTNWSTSLRNVELSQERKLGGGSSLKFIDEKNNATNAIQTVNVPAIPGKTYQGSFMAYNTGPSNGVQLYLQFLNSAGTRIGVAYLGSTVMNQWAPVVVTGTAPAGTTQVNIMVYSTSGAVMTVYVDEAALSYRD